MSFAQRFKSFKTIDEISGIEKKNSISFEDPIVNGIKKEIISYADSPENIFDKKPQSAMAKQKLQLNSYGSHFPQMQNAATTENSRKRSYSKPCPKSKKKSRMQSSNFNDDDKILDNDLLVLAKSINNDKNMDSDSSNDAFFDINDTIIVEDPPSDPQLNLFSDGNSSKEKNYSTPAFFNNSLQSYVSTDGSKHHTFAVEKKKGEFKSGVPVFREVLPTSFSRNNSLSPESSTVLSNSSSTKINDKKISKSTKKKTSKELEVNNLASEVRSSVQSSISDNTLLTSDVCQNNKSLNYQSIYASMGLDEDLCDTEQASSKILNSDTKEINKSTSSPDNLLNLPDVKIKTEEESFPNDEYYDNKKIIDNNEKLTIDGCQIDMTFEAELCDDGDDDDDVPLLLLRNQKSTDVNNSQIRPETANLHCETTLTNDKTNSAFDNVNNLPPTLFIKKELIENEIISESQAVSSKNLTLMSDAKDNSSIHSLPVKIKTEPVDAEYLPETVTKIKSLTSLETVNNKLSTLLEKNTEEEKESSVSKPVISTDLVKQNSVLAGLLQSKNTATSVFNTKTYAASNSTADNASSGNLITHFSFPNILDSAKPTTKKSKKVTKKKKVVKNKTENVIEGLKNPSQQLASLSELSQISTSDSVSNLNESISSNSNNFDTATLDLEKNNASDLNKSSSKILDTIEEVVKKSRSKKKKQTKVKFKTVSKKSDQENLLQFTSNSEVSSKDNKEFETSEINNANSDVLSLEKEGLSAKKGKRKKGALDKNLNIDENAPITLLIKRQKSDTDVNSSDSFRCVPNNSSTVESRSVYDDVLGIDPDQCEDSSFLSVEQNTETTTLLSEAATVPQKTKKKKTGKKLSKKKAKKGSLLAATGNEKIATDFSSMPIKRSESNSLVHTQSKELLHENITNHSAIPNLSIQGKKSSSTPDLIANNAQKEQNNFFYSDLTTTGIGNLSSRVNMNSVLSSYDVQSEESMSSNSFQASVSGDISSQSEMHTFNSLSVQPPKKKRRARSNGWYKKKKSKKERSKAKQNLTSTVIYEVQNPVSSIINDPLFTKKTPIVVIKNLNSEIQNIEKNRGKIISNESEIQHDDKNACAQFDSESLENAPVSSFSRGQRRKANKLSKKMQSEASLKEDSFQNEKETTLTELSVSESNKISNNADIDNHLQNKSSDVSEENSRKHLSEEINDDSDITIAYEKDIAVKNAPGNDEMTAMRRSSVDSNAINNNQTKLFPSLNVQQFAKDIAAIEALLEKQTNHDLNCDSLSQNVPESDLQAVEIQNTDKSATVVKDTNKNLSDSSVEKPCIQPIRPDGMLKNINSFPSNSNVNIKKELDDDFSKNSVTQLEGNSSQINPFRAVLLDKESTTNETTAKGATARNNSIPPLVSIKKEKDIESQSSNKNTALTCTDSQASRFNVTENTDKINSMPNSQCNASLNTSQKSQFLEVNSIALSIKKEVTHMPKSVSNIARSFKDQNDLIQHVYASSFPNNPCIANSKINSKSYFSNSHLSDSELDPIPESQKKPLELLDDEIQVIPKEPRNVPCIDLTEDDSPSNFEQAFQRKMSEYHSIASMSSEFIESNKKIKTENVNFNAKSVTPETSNEIQTSDSSKQISAFSFSKSDQVQSSVDPSKVRTIVSDSSFNPGSYVHEDPIKREVGNRYIVRDKYIDEYFKHPFPPSLVSYKKRRNRSKTYERIDSKTWNLSLDEVESRLKHSENTVPQFGKKLGDIIKLEKYPVSKSEVECYHRILGVAPSHKLLSKCYIPSSNKFIAAINNEFEPSEFANKSETDNATHMTCTLDDILQGITETKNMSGNFDGETNVTISDRDCPSAETKDSFDSSVSHSVDKYRNLTPDKDIDQSTSDSLKRNEINSPSENAFLISQNSSLSCISNFEDVSNNTLTNIDTFINKPSNSEASSFIKSNEISNVPYLQSNILANLNLPSKEVVNNILNSTGTSHSTTFEAPPDTTPNSCSESNNTTVNNELSLPPDYSHLESGVSSEVNTNISQTVNANVSQTVNTTVSQTLNTTVSQTLNTTVSQTVNTNALQTLNTNKIIDIINLPVLELRKILETASSLQSTSNDYDALQSDNINHEEIWKSKETYEYNHTQSIPVSDSDPIPEIQKVDGGVFESSKNTEEQTRNENSDDEYVDNEPIHHDSDSERHDSSSNETEEPEEPIPVPQYKSKWEKIMERKSQELKEKEKISELYLKDCVPMSSRVNQQNKKKNISNKALQSADKKTEKLVEKVNSKIQKNKLKGNKGKQVELKSKTGTEVAKNNKSQKTVKKIEKQNSKSNEPEETKKKSPVKKNKSKSAETPNLFAPDKLVKNSPVKKPVATVVKSDDSKSKRFYGNRVTNRGTFLTETNPAKNLTNIKIPKKIPEVTKKITNVRSEEFHSMVKSPDINIDLPRVSSGRNFNKSIDNRRNSDVYKSPLSNSSSSVTSHFIRTKRMRDRQNAYLNSRPHFTEKNDSYNKNYPHLPDPYSKPLHLSDESVPNRSPLLTTQSNHHDEISMGQKIPVLTTTSNLHNESPLGQKIPVLCSSSSIPSDSFQSNIDPSKTLLQKIMSVFQNNSNPTYAAEETRLPNLENTETAWNNGLYNSRYGIVESSITQNIKSQQNVPLDSVNNPFRNISQVDSSNSQRAESEPQPNINLPFNSIISVADSLDPRRAALGLQSNMLSNSMSSSPALADTLDPRRAALGLQTNIYSNSMSGSSAVTETMDPRRAALRLQPNMPLDSLGSLGTSSANSLDPRRTALGSHSNIPVVSSISTSSSFGNIPGSEILDPRRASLGTNQTFVNKKPLDPSFNTGSQILNSPPYVAPMNSASQAPRKAICLVPPNLKTLVGHETIETYNVRLLMLEWSVDWLIQQQKLHDPPPISNALKKVTSSYESFEDYYNTYFPLMLLETWHRIYVSWTHLNQTAPFLCQITSYSVKNHYVSVDCQTVFSTDNRRKGIFPDEGSILMVKYSTKSNEYTIKILGYVTHVKTRRYNPVTDSKICSSLPQQKDVNPDSLQILSLTFMGAYNSEDIDKRQPVRIHVLCTVKHNLKQNDAMLYINKSPLQRSILNPVADGLLTFSLTPRNSPEEKVNECVRDITKGILSPHPLPLLTVVRAKPESDRLNIIPLLIHKMKTAYKTKVLLCVRTVRALGDIAANICLQQSLKLVIINKRCDTNLQFQKYLLDELVACETKKMEEAPGEKPLKNDGHIKIKKQIIRDCDVILSLIRNSHDDFLNETFHETDSIAQMCCIVDEANLCTEPETLIPILHGISKLILIGDPDYTAKVLSKTASAYDFNQSFFQRAYDLDLLTE